MKIFYLIAVVSVILTISKKTTIKKYQINKNGEILFPYSDSSFSFKNIVHYDDVLKEKYINQVARLFDNEHHQFLNLLKKNGETDFKNRFNLIDINNDGKYDLIYTGETGGEGYEAVIVLNTPKGFKIVFNKPQIIKNLEFKDHKLFRISMVDGGCCASYLSFFSAFEASYVGGSPKFNRIYYASTFHETYMPKKFFRTSIPFEVLNDNYKMRLAPVIDDIKKNETATEGSVMLTGNTIDTLNKGVRGRAIAEQTDNTGRVWWFVEIDRNYRAYGHLFYENDKDDFAAKMGWISSRFVKKMDK